jgi:large subunit ribosomal protein L30
MPRRFVWHPGRGPAKTEAPITDAKTVEIRQVRSEIGHAKRMRQTLDAIGLKHHQDVVIRPYTPSLAGQLKRVRHLISVKKHD